jgi:GTP-binding protein YchF
LGNKFLAHIREADLIAHVVRAFSDESVIREGSIGPEEDMETVNMELILADLQTLEKVRDEKRDRAPLRCASEGQGDRGGRGGKREAIMKLGEGLNRGKLAREVELDEEEKEAAEELQLLTAKKILYVVNADTKTDWGKVKQLENKYPGQVCVIDAKLEADLAEFAAAEREEYLHSLGIKEAGVDQLIRLAYRQLGLISFLTAPDSAKATPGKGWEVRAWTIKSGTKAPAAAGVIHSDFEKNFIKAEVVDFRDFVILGGWQKCREAGRTRAEGREYEIKDGEVVEFKVGT